MKRLLLLHLLVTSLASAQDSSFRHLRIRGAALRLPVTGHIDDHWRANTGAQLELASNVGSSELALGIGRVGFEPIDGRPPFTETIISLTWTRSVVALSRARAAFGARLSDVRMDFDDPAMVPGLRNEEEMLLAAIGRGHASVGRGFSLFGEATYGVLMLSTRTPTVSVALGVEYNRRMPGWLRDFLR